MWLKILLVDHRSSCIPWHSCIIVDSTRRGKRIPDSLSKTIPIWCSTFNRAIAKHINLSWDTSFHSLPSAVSRSEHAQIEARIDEFAQRLLVCYIIHPHTHTCRGWQLISSQSDQARLIWIVYRACWRSRYDLFGIHLNHPFLSTIYPISRSYLFGRWYALVHLKQWNQDVKLVQVISMCKDQGMIKKLGVMWVFLDVICWWWRKKLD